MTYATPDVAAARVTQTKTLLPQRMSWGAILAGVFVTIILQFMFYMLGLAIGAAAINPEAATNPAAQTWTSAAVMWLAGTGLLSIFAGGVVVGRLSSVEDTTDATLHGIVMWAVGAILVFGLLFSSAGNAINGLLNSLGQGVALLGQSAATIAPEVAQAVDLQAGTVDAIVDDVSNISEEITQVEAQQLRIDVQRFLTATEETRPERREALVNTLANSTSLTEAEINATVDEWETTFQNAVANAEETAEAVSGAVLDTVAAAAGALFLILLLGAFAGAAGAAVGSATEAEWVAQRTVTRTTIAAEAT